MKTIIRADANPAIGVGHFIRCMTLARELISTGHEVEIQTKCEIPALLKNARSNGINVTEIPSTETSPLVESNDASSRPEWACLDGYHFTTPDYLAAQKIAGKLLIIDDAPRETEYPADIILDNNYGASDHKYPAPRAALLLGPNYTLIRPEITALRDGSQQRSRTNIKSIVVTFGGSDPAGATNQVVEILSKIPYFEHDVTVIAGPANSKVTRLKQLCADAGFQLLVDPPNLPEILATSDLAICGAGTTIWELMCLGVPILAITIADNQVTAARALASDSLIGYLGDSTKLSTGDIAEAVQDWISDPDKLTHMATKGARIVDGGGTSRVIDKMIELTDGATAT